MPGYGPVSIVPTGWKDPKAPQVAVEEGRLVTHMDARAYFAETCNAGVYNHEEYVALNLLGKTLRYTTDLSGAGCGCNAAFYLTSLRQNPNPSDCSDYYCDANNVCGQSCAEIDIQEANQHAWHSTLHTKTDRFGVGGGYGGGDGYNGARDWGSADYGPGARCIDTALPFEVAASFPVDGQGMLTAMKVELSQQGRSCPLSTNLGSYNGMGELSAALKAGMTPIISYWSDDGMLWMDGKGTDGQGPCAVDNAAACSESVKFSGFSLEKIGGGPITPVPPIPQATPPPTAAPAARPTSPPLTPAPAPAPAPAPVPAPAPLPAPLPAPVPVPVPVPMPQGLDPRGKLAIFQALGTLCGTGSTVHRIGSTLLGYVLACGDRLHTSQYQGCISMSAMMLGVASSTDGPFLYRALFTIVAAVVAASIADFEVKAMELAAEQVSETLIVLQVGVAMGIATHFGFDGSQVLFGVSLGLLGAHGCGSWVRAANGTVHGLAVVWYSLGALFGGMVFTAWRHVFLKTLAPLVGGFLVATGFSGALSRLLAAAGASPVAILPNPHLDWATSAVILLGTRGRGAVAGALGCALLALVFMGFGGRRRRLLAVLSLLVYIMANGIAAMTVFNSGGWLWPFCGCALWAAITAAAAWRQLDLTDDAEIRGFFQDAMSTKTLISRRDLYELPLVSGYFGNDGERLMGGEQGGHQPLEPSAPPLSQPLSQDSRRSRWGPSSPSGGGQGGGGLDIGRGAPAPRPKRRQDSNPRFGR